MTKRVLKLALLVAFILAIGAPTFASTITVSPSNITSLPQTITSWNDSDDGERVGKVNSTNDEWYITISGLSGVTIDKYTLNIKRTNASDTSAITGTATLELFTAGDVSKGTANITFNVPVSGTGGSTGKTAITAADNGSTTGGTAVAPTIASTKITADVSADLNIKFTATNVDAKIETDFDNETTLKNDYGLTFSNSSYDKNAHEAVIVLSGSPKQANKSGVSFKLTGYLNGKATTTTFKLIINGQPPVFNDTVNSDDIGEENSALPGKAIAYGEEIDDYTVSLDTKGPITWSAKGLPTGLSITADPDDSARAYITGTPTKEGKFPYSVTAKNSAGSGSATVNGTFLVEREPAFPTTTTLPAATLGNSYSQTISMTGYGVTLVSYDVSPASYDNGGTVWTSGDFTVSVNTSKQQLTIASSKVVYYPEEGEYNITIRVSNDVTASEPVEETITIPVSVTAPKITTTSLKTAKVGKTGAKGYASKLVATGTLPIRWSAELSNAALTALSNAGLEDVEDLIDLGLVLSVDANGYGEENLKKQTSTAYLIASNDTPIAYAVSALGITFTVENAQTDNTSKPVTSTLNYTSKGTKPSFSVKKDTKVEAVADDTINISGDALLVKGTAPIVITASGYSDPVEVTTDLSEDLSNAGTWKGLAVTGSMPSKATTVTFTATNPFTKETATKKVVLSAQTPIEITDPGAITAAVGGKVSTALKATGSNIEWSIQNDDTPYTIGSVSADILKKYGVKIDKKSGTISSNKVIVDTTNAPYVDSLTFRVVASNDFSQDSLDVTMNLTTTAPKVTVAKTVEGVLGTTYNKGKGTKITVVGTPDYTITSDDLPAGFYIQQVTGKPNIAYLYGTPTSLTIVNGKVAAQTGTVTFEDAAGNEGSANISLIVRDQKPTFKKTSVTLGGYLVAGDDASISLNLYNGTGWYKWTAKGSGVTATIDDADSVAVNEQVSLAITAPATVTKNSTATITVTAENVYDSTLKATLTLKVKVKTGEDGEEVTIDTTAHPAHTGADNTGFNEDLIEAGTIEGALAPVAIETAAPAAVEAKTAEAADEAVEEAAEAAVEGTLTLGAERGAGSFTEAEKDALEGYIVAAILPEIEVTVDGQYELEVDLAEEVPAGAKLVYFAFPRNAEPDDDDEIVDFIDKDTGEYIEAVPESHVVIVVPWFDAGVKYAPVIAVEAE